jgi:hypothetical protein
MGRFEKINKILRTIDSKNSGYVDTLNDNDVNNIPEVKELLKGWKIVNFSVIRDNETKILANGSKTNIGGNRLISFNFTLIPNI